MGEALAHGVQPASGAFRGARGAGVAAVEEQEVVGGGPLFFGNMLAQFLLDAQGGGASPGYQGETVADAEDVGIDGQGGLAEGYGLDDIGGLAAYTGEAGERFERVGHFATVFFDEHSCSADERFGFVVGKSYALDVFENRFRIRRCHYFRGGEVGKERGRNYVDTLVCALRRQDYGYKQVKRGVVVEFGLCFWHIDRKPIDDVAVPFFFSHIQLVMSMANSLPTSP